MSKKKVVEINFTVGKVFDDLSQSDNNEKPVGLTVGKHGTRFGRKKLISKVWKVKPQGLCFEDSKGESNSDMVQEVACNSAQTGGLVVEPAEVASNLLAHNRLDDKEEQSRTL
ncbi:hypothetical protein LIER_43910 [Lithospermum erythrorhizon]|uniref:Uncharacterized protein n=1 Tax=Lithospermum erythrorhizon TaxID=34254 RepID=A0AAV3R7J5_LITER